MAIINGINARATMKRKEIWVGIAVIVILFVLAFILDAKTKSKLEPLPNVADTNQVEERVVEDSGLSLDVRNTSYVIDGTTITLVDGVAKNPVAPSSTTMRTTTVLEGPAFADVNGDGSKDAVVILRDETGGSGVFYYVASVVMDKSVQKSTNAILLGDRIRIREIAVDNGTISVSILDRAQDEPMSTTPAVLKTLQFKVNGTTLTQLK